MSNAAIKKSRPVYLNLTQIRLPLPGVVSILHRVSGALLFLAPIWLLFLLDRALASPEGFEAAQRYLAMIPLKLIAGIGFVLIGGWTIWSYATGR